MSVWCANPTKITSPMSSATVTCADRARVGLGQVAADRTRRNPVTGLADGVAQGVEYLAKDGPSGDGDNDGAEKRMNHPIQAIQDPHPLSEYRYG